MRALALAVCLFGFSSPALAESFRCSGATLSPYPALVATEHVHPRFAPATSSPTKQFTAFFAAFDDADDDDADGVADRRANPEFVTYELIGVSPDAEGNYNEPPLSIDGPSAWYDSPELRPIFTGVTGITTTRIDRSYSGIGTIWNRGHLAMSEHAQRIGAEAACNTHLFWNGTPQAAALNQGPWLHLEYYSGAAANKYGRVWIVAGPIFDPATPHLAIADSGEVPVEVPDAFFKIIIHDAATGIETLAFIFEQPNVIGSTGQPEPAATYVKCSQASGMGHEYNHSEMLTSIAEIERRTGLTFFADRPDREALISARASALWPIETQYWDRNTCAGQRSHP